MVVNNWFIIADGLGSVLGDWYRLGWMFCISFYFCIHILILNILVTSIVETYERLIHENAPIDARYRHSANDMLDFDDPGSGGDEGLNHSVSCIGLGEEELMCVEDSAGQSPDARDDMVRVLEGVRIAHAPPEIAKCFSKSITRSALPARPA
mmetsp:Transcript_9360/g.28997  ORF Transcript_9360/g.28997 Transcript_9360/m.28997 type:complete len:152 (-) Transcript_9360:302-757(-)